MRYWTPEQKSELLRMAKAGKSGTQIANVLSEKYDIPFTRSMIIGMAARLGSRLTSVVRRGPPRPQVKAVRSKEGVMTAAKPVDPAAPIEMKPCTIWELNRSKCKYPLWPDSVRPHNSHLYCGAKATVGPYCTGHAAVTYRPVKPALNLRRL